MTFTFWNNFKIFKTVFSQRFLLDLGSFGAVRQSCLSIWWYFLHCSSRSLSCHWSSSRQNPTGERWYLHPGASKVRTSRSITDGGRWTLLLVAVVVPRPNTLLSFFRSSTSTLLAKSRFELNKVGFVQLMTSSRIESQNNSPRMKPDACPKVFRIVLNCVVQCVTAAAAASEPTKATMVAPQMRVLEGRFGLASHALC